MSTDQLSALGHRLGALDDTPVGAHPAVLDDVHRALIGELDRLADVVNGESRSARAGRGPDPS